MTEQKICGKCLILKPSVDFYKNKKSKDGLRSSCVKCGNDYKSLNGDKVKEQNKKYNKKRKEKKKEWSSKNKVKVNESKKNGY